MHIEAIYKRTLAKRMFLASSIAFCACSVAVCYMESERSVQKFNQTTNLGLRQSLIPRLDELVLLSIPLLRHL